jgi:uncharacterized membrane protein YphA (DoxX/SURF4 family)
VSALLLSARCLLAAVFAIAGAGKLADLDGSRRALEDFAVPPGLARFAGPALPLAELAVALALLVRPSAVVGAAGALALLCVFAGGVVYAIAKGRAPDCHCFGQLHSEPAGPATLARNAALALPALLVLVAGAGPSLDSLASLDAAQLALVAVSVLAVALALAAAELWRVNRRLRKELGGEAAPRPAPGLERGVAAPGFALVAVRGDATTLADLLRAEQPLVLVFLSTRCGPCVRMLPALAEWQESLSGRITLAAVFTGEHEEIERLAERDGLSIALAQERSETFTLYALRATPSAVLIDAGGAIAAAPAEGSHAIEALIRSATAEVDPHGDLLIVGA